MHYFKKIIYITLTLLLSSISFAHGVIERPASREQFCGVESKPDEIYQDKMTHEKCRPIMTKADGSLDNTIYNFMAVLSHSVGRSNKSIEQLPTHVCGFNSEMWGGGKTPWDSAIDWPTTLINNGSQKFVWNISWGNHFGDTEEFAYWITKPDFQFDSNKELTWNDFEAVPFCKLKYNDAAPNANPDVIPDKANARFTTLCNVPARTNRSVIYGEWGRTSSTYERFHSCMDVVFSTDSTPPAKVKAVINSLPAQIVGATQLNLNGSQSTGANLIYNWSINAEDLKPYQLENSQTATPRLIIANIDVQQKVTVNLTVEKEGASNTVSASFTHMPVISNAWKMVGRANLTSTIKAGDKIQLRLIDTSGKDYMFPVSPLILNEETAKPENWAYTLALLVNPVNLFSAKIGVLSADNKTIEPIRSDSENMIFVPVKATIANAYIQLDQAANPVGDCLSQRRPDANSYWLSYDVYTDSAPLVLDFSATGIDLTVIGIDQGVFSGIKVLDKNKLLINSKPSWVTKSTPGYIGFYGPNHGSYDPFNSPLSANCHTGSSVK